MTTRWSRLTAVLAVILLSGAIAVGALAQSAVKSSLVGKLEGPEVVTDAGKAPKTFTADDFVFWFEDIYRNKDLVPTPAAVLAINGKQGVIEKVDTYTVRYKFPEPYFMLPDVLAGSTELAGQMWGYRAMGGFAPAHYLKQFLPKYANQAELDKKAKDAKFDSWVRYFLNRNDWATNPDLPVLSPWKTVTPINPSTWTLERNAYSVFVDTAGNQLPYIDKVVLTLA